MDAHQRQLHVVGQRGRDAVGVDLAAIEAVGGLGLQVDLVTLLVREPDDLVLDRRAVARADALDRALVQRRPVQVGADEVVGRRGRVGDPARPLGQRRRRAVVIEREPRRRIVARLPLERRVVDGLAVDAARRAGLEPRQRQAQPRQRARQRHRRRLAGPAAGGPGVADEDRAAQERAGRDDHGPAAVAHAHRGGDADDPGPRAAGPAGTVRVGVDARDLGLAQRHAGRVLEPGPHRLAVAALVGLGPGRAHRRALRRVEPAELDAGGVDDLGHRAAERVDLLDQVALGHAADRRVARHLRDQLERAGQDQRARAQPRGGQRGLAAGVAGADDDHVVGVGVREGHAITRSGWRTRDRRGRAWA